MNKVVITKMMKPDIITGLIGGEEDEDDGRGSGR